MVQVLLHVLSSIGAAQEVGTAVEWMMENQDQVRPPRCVLLAVLT